MKLEAITLFIGRLVFLAAVLVFSFLYGRDGGSLPVLASGLSCLATLIILLAKGLRDREPHADSPLFTKFIDDLPSGGVIAQLRNGVSTFRHKFGQLDALWGFADQWDNAEHEFHDIKMERLRRSLLSEVRAFQKSYYGLTETVGAGYSEVDLLYKHLVGTEKEPLYHESMRVLEAHERSVVATHQELVRVGRKRTGVQTSSAPVE